MPGSLATLKSTARGVRYYDYYFKVNLKGKGADRKSRTRVETRWRSEMQKGVQVI